MPYGSAGDGPFGATLSVLAIDDDAGDAALLRRQLEGLARYQLTFTHAASFEGAERALRRGDIDVIFLDYQLGPASGDGVLEAMRSAGDLRPVIMLTGRGDETLVATLMRGGADDYLVKGELEPVSLARAIENARAQHTRRTIEAHNRQLLEDLQIAKTMLEVKNRRLAELYETAHEFVDHVSHEFRTPLTVIKEFASIMRDGLAGETNGEQRKYLDIISHRVDDLSILVDDMLDISKLESGILGIARCDTDTASIVERVRPMLERRAEMSGAALTIELAPGLPAVYCDPEKIGRVVLNLVINALKFCGENGAVALRVSADTGQCEVRFAVQDNGPGIAPDTLATLFQRFRQVSGRGRGSPKGFGLGLSIAKELVGLNLGDISVESRLGAGSVFSFTVPWSERRSLLKRYLNRVHEVRDGCTHIGLIHIGGGAPALAGQHDELEYFVRHLVRRSDLLFQSGAEDWLLAAATTSPDLTPIIQRIEHAHAESLRNQGTRGLIRPELECLGAWCIHDQTEAFLQTFMEHDSRMKETAHV